MIVCHFFLRVIKNKRYLMCQASCSSGSKSPWSGPVVILEALDGESAMDWLSRARDAAVAAHPDHALGDVTYPSVTARDGKATQVFDINLKQPVKKGLLQRIFL